MSTSTLDEDRFTETPAQQEQEPPEGAHCAVQTLYEGRSKCDCCKNWVEEYPPDLRAAVEEQPETKQKALIVRMRKNHGDGKPLVMDSIVVQSSSLRKTLGEVFQGYRGITTSLKKLVFKAPFHPFYYRWRVLTRILEQQRHDNPVAAAYTQLLYDLLDAELSDIRTEIDDLLQHRVITYPHLWALFEPGTRVVTTADGNERFFTVMDNKFSNEGDRETKGLSVTARFVEWDGKRFAFAKTKFSINEFNGTQSIDELEILPASFHSARDEAERKAIARGCKFQDLRGFHYMAYSGLARSLVGGRRKHRNVCEP